LPREALDHPDAFLEPLGQNQTRFGPVSGDVRNPAERLNDLSAAVLGRIAVSHVAAGAQVVAPSDMMDGRVHAIRRALLGAGVATGRILSYAAKYASAYYGPFREAAACAPKAGDRKNYQMDPPNGEEALNEIAADLAEGAEAVIVKPALAYLDVIARARDRFRAPIVSYNVSGEYSMLRLGVDRGLMRPSVIHESLVAMKRAGASRIISYFTPDFLNGSINP
jgi:porphobilinogen synthase